MKLGPKGSMVRRGDDCLYVPVLDSIQVVDTTGAGDLYCAGFLYGYLNGWSLLDATRLATASGNLAVTFFGGTDPAYTRERVMELYRQIAEADAG